MAILTLTPSRFFAADTFVVGSYAYVVADRPVRKGGFLITPEPLVTAVAEVGDTMTFDLIPNAEIDEAEPFLYTLSVFDGDGKRIYDADFVMPATDSAIFDILTVTQDPDSCTPTTLTDNSL